MAYTEEGVRAKLSALNETQESIVTVAQWIMFHRRYADRSAGVWLQKVRDSGSSKRLNLVYLANEVVQQSKARKKDDFLIAFSPIIAEATATAYRGATSEVQTKLRRVVEVWKQRQIFDPSIQESVETRINEIDKSRGSGKKPLLRGLSPFSSSEGMPAELAPLQALQNSLNKAILAAASTTTNISAEYDKLLAPDATVPAPPVYAARLSGLLKSLATASGAVSERIKARTALIAGLSQLLESNQAALAADEAQLGDIDEKKTTAEGRKRKVEDDILRGAGADEERPGSRGSQEADDDRPQMEALTPPPVESFTPEESPAGPLDVRDASMMDAFPSGIPASRPFEGSGVDGSMFKKRKIDEVAPPGDAMADLDDDVAELLRAESGAL